jgi:hypothetical protein
VHTPLLHQGRTYPPPQAACQEKNRKKTGSFSAAWTPGHQPSVFASLDGAAPE